MFHPLRRLRVLVVAMTAAVLLVPRAAHAIVPTISSVSVANPYTPANTMMYSVTVTVSGAYDDADHNVRVGYAAAGTNCTTGTWKFSHVERFASTTTKTITLYNFQPGTNCDYKVQVGNPGWALRRPDARVYAGRVAYAERRSCFLSPGSAKSSQRVCSRGVGDGAPARRHAGTRLAA